MSVIYVHSLYRKYLLIILFDKKNIYQLHPIVQTSCSSTQSCKHRTRWFAPHALHLVPAASAADSASAAEADSVSPPTPCLSFMAQEQQIKCNGVGFQRHYGGCRAVHPGILCTCSTSGRNHHTARSPGQARQAGWPIHNSRTFRSNHVFSGSYCCNRVPLFPLFHCVRRCCRLAGATEGSARSCHVV